MQATKQIVVFKLGNVQYGFPIEQVKEIIRYIVPTKLPNVPNYIEGISSLRGKVHVIIDLRNFFCMGKQNVDDNTKIIIANNNDTGFIVDDVNMIVTQDKKEFNTADNLPDYIDKRYVQHILKIDGSIIIVLDMTGILDMSKGEKDIA